MCPCICAQACCMAWVELTQLERGITRTRIWRNTVSVSTYYLQPSFQIQPGQELAQSQTAKVRVHSGWHRTLLPGQAASPAAPPGSHSFFVKADCILPRRPSPQRSTADVCRVTFPHRPRLGRGGAQLWDALGTSRVRGARARASPCCGAGPPPGAAVR